MNRGSKPPPMRLALRIVAILMSVVAAPVGVDTAQTQAPAPTPSGPVYTINWKANASDSATFQTAAMSDCLHKPGLGKLYCGSYREYRTSTSVQGSAVARLMPNGVQFATKNSQTGPAPDIRVISAADSHQYDMKDHETWNCGDLVQTHTHRSIVLTNLAPKYPFPVMAPPTKRPDGTWIIKDARPEWNDTCLQTDNDRACWGMNRTDIRKVPCNPFGFMIAAAPPGTFDLEAGGSGNLFQKQVTYRGPDEEELLGGDKTSLNVSWDIVVHRKGACLGLGKNPLDENRDAGINDEEIALKPDKTDLVPRRPPCGDPATPGDTTTVVHATVTCDGIPIQNAFLDVKIAPHDLGHDHGEDDGPPGKINNIALPDPNQIVRVGPTASDGTVAFLFTPGESKDDKHIGISGLYQITATSYRYPDESASTGISVGVKGLASMSGDKNYIVCRPSRTCSTGENHNDDKNHESGANGTASTIQGVSMLAAAFAAAQDTHNTQMAGAGCKGVAPWPPSKLLVIDASLPSGGLLDIDNNWKPAHSCHNTGVGVDFSVNGWSEKLRKICYDGQVMTISPRGWLTATMMGAGLKYGYWDSKDLCSDYKNYMELHPKKPYPLCPGDQRWHLHFKQ